MKLRKINGIMPIMLMIGMLMIISLAFLNMQDFDNRDLENVSGEEIVLLNDLSQYCSRYWNEGEESFTKYMTCLVQRENKYSFCVLNTEGDIRFSYGDMGGVNLNEAYKKHNMIGDIWVNDKLVGKIILEDEVYKHLSSQKQMIYNIAYIFLFAAILIELGYIFYIRKNIIKPFQKLKEFASEIAKGNLNIPLERENNLFGEFAESFDIMREELLLTRKREENARKKKEEFAISLNHDIKAPIAAIKAIAELLELKISKNKTKKEELLKKIGEMNEKATQTNRLVNNMLNVSIDSDYDSSPNMDYYSIEEIISVLKGTDYKEKIQDIQMENCLIKTDLAKLTQIFDNCITNSYKYADTPIVVLGEIKEDGTYCIRIKDRGNTLRKDEVENLCIKYYRGENSRKEEGSGLGLHVSKLMMEHMEGALCCQQDTDGFCVKLYLPM